MKMNTLNSYSLPEAAERYGILYWTLWNYVRKGYVNVFDVGHGTRPVYRVYEKDMEEFMSKYDKNKKRSRVVVVDKPSMEAPVVATLKADYTYEFLRKQLEAKNAEIARLQKEIKDVKETLFDLSIKLDGLT